MKLSMMLVTMSMAAWSMTALGQAAHVHSMTATSNAPAVAEASSSHRVVGIVKKVDASARTVTLDHEPVKSLSWPAMTMTFKVDDPAEMRKLKAGARVEVDMVQRGNDYVVTAVR